MQDLIAIDFLFELLKIDSPSGDECVMADFLMSWITQNLPDCRIERLRDCVVAWNGERPETAVFAHIDTTGWTLGRIGDAPQLIEIGEPAPENGDEIKIAGDSAATGKLERIDKAAWTVRTLQPKRGDRLVYAMVPKRDSEWVQSPYLDNRAGIWAAMSCMLSCKNVAVAFTTGEEVAGGGALICARYLWEKFRIRHALISDITWDTQDVHCGRGVAISRRDSSIPSQQFVDQIIRLAEESGIKYQIEVESGGSSDGRAIERSGFPIDWIFIGAPEERPHSSTERLAISDLESMAYLLVYLADNLKRASSTRTK